MRFFALFPGFFFSVFFTGFFATAPPPSLSNKVPVELDRFQLNELARLNEVPPNVDAKVALRNIAVPVAEEHREAPFTNSSSATRAALSVYSKGTRTPFSPFSLRSSSFSRTTRSHEHQKQFVSTKVDGTPQPRESSEISISKSFSCIQPPFPERGAMVTNNITRPGGFSPVTKSRGRILIEYPAPVSSALWNKGPTV